MRRRLGLLLATLAPLVLAIASCNYIQPPTGGISMEEAVEIVTEKVLPDAVPAGATYVCTRLDEAIPAGSLIEEAAPEGAPKESARLSPKALTVSEESFFFFLDLAPQAYYAHPVKYIVVSKTGESQVVEAEWWPKINGATPEQLLADFPDASHVVAGNADMTRPVGNVMTFNLAHYALVRPEGFIVVQGLMPNEPVYQDAVSTYQNGMNFFNGYKNTRSAVVGLAEDDAREVLDEIDRMAGEGLSPITLFIIAHGSVDRVRLGGRQFTSFSFGDEMAEYPNTLFNVVLGSCHSGSFIDDLSVLANVRVVETACGSQESAWADLDGLLVQLQPLRLVDDYNPEDSGSEWMSSILRAAATVVGDSAKWTKVQSFASANQIPETCVLLCATATGATGENEWLGLTQNLDLTNRGGWTKPQRYCSWELVVPPIPPTPIIPPLGKAPASDE